MGSRIAGTMFSIRSLVAPSRFRQMCIRDSLYATRIDYKFFVFLTKVLPARFLNWLIYQLYGK